MAGLNAFKSKVDNVQLTLDRTWQFLCLTIPAILHENLDFEAWLVCRLCCPPDILSMSGHLSCGFL